jgi:SEC-C motif
MLTVPSMARVSRNAPCPCGSGKKFKLCCMPAEGGPGFALREIETIDATGRGCRWTVFKREGPEGAAKGELAEHVCTSDRYEIQPPDGWLRNGRPVPMMLVLEALPPQLTEWAMRQSFDAVSDEELTPFGVELARVILLAGVVVDLVGDLHAPRHGRLRRALDARKRRAAA